MKLVAILACLSIGVLLIPPITSALAEEPVVWSNIPSQTITTTEGFLEMRVAIQVAKFGDRVYFRAEFDYPTPTDPEKVFFAVEFAAKTLDTPMGKGNQMIIVSQKGPRGGKPQTYSYYLEETETQPVGIIPSEVTVDLNKMAPSRDGNAKHYEMIFSRPMKTDNPERQYQFELDRPVRLAFAVSEWGQGSTHGYTLLGYELTLTEQQVLLAPVSKVTSLEEKPGAIVVQRFDTHRMALTPQQALTEGVVIFFVLLALIVYTSGKHSKGQRRMLVQ